MGGRGAGPLTEDGLPAVFAVDVLAPYLLTALTDRPDRLIYVSSSMHIGARPAGLAASWRDMPQTGHIDYSQSKFLVTALAFAVARLWPGGAVERRRSRMGSARMGGPSAPDELEDSARTRAWLAEGSETEALVTGEYLRHGRILRPNPATRNVGAQDEVLALCESIGRVSLNRT